LHDALRKSINSLPGIFLHAIVLTAKKMAEYPFSSHIGHIQIPFCKGRSFPAFGHQGKAIKRFVTAGSSLLIYADSLRHSPPAAAYRSSRTPDGLTI